MLFLNFLVNIINTLENVEFGVLKGALVPSDF